MDYKPSGYTSVAPYLIVDGAEAAIVFLERVFGAERLRLVLGEGGKIAHGEVRIDDTVLMFCDAVPGWPALPSHVHVYVKDVDATFQKALHFGATPIKEPIREGDEDKRGGFKDPGGTTYWVGTRQE